MKICLDPGHVKGYNTGCDKVYREGTAMFSLAQKLKAALEQYEGVEVFLTRGLNDNPSLEERGKLARSLKCDLLLSLHSNAFSDGAACGVSTFYSVKRDSKALAKAFAEAVAAEMKKDTGVTYSRGAKTRTYVGANDGKTYDYYGIIRNSVVGSIVQHAIIIEHGFHTNPAECAWLLQDKNLDRLAAVDARVVAEHCGLVAKAAPQPFPAATDTIAKGDLVVIKESATTYGESEKPIPAWVKKNIHTVAEVGTAKKRPEQAKLKEINSWVYLRDLTKQPGLTDTFQVGDKVKVVGTTLWKSGVVMAAWVAAGCVFEIMRLNDNGTEAVIGRKIAGKLAVTGTIYTKYLKRA